MNLSSIDLNLLVVFNAVYRTRSTTRAGEELHVTQSAVSNALRRLKSIIGEPLFNRTGRGMIPTAVALRLAGPAQEALVQIQDALESTRRFDPSKSRCTFRVYVSDVGQMVALPKLLSRLWVYAPNVRVETIATSPQEARMLMERGDVDLAFGHFDDFGVGFFRQRLFEERYVCLVRAKHRVIRKQVTLQQLISSRHAVYRPTAGSHEFFESLVDRVFAKHGKTRKVALRLSHSLGIAEIVRRTDLVALLPSRLARELARQGGLRVLRTPFLSPTFEICQYWHAGRQADAAHAWLRTLIESIFLESKATRGSLG